MKQPPLRLLAAAAVMLAIAGSHLPAAAQYVWLDEKGTRQYSDMPPPPSVPASRILKQPGKAVAPASGPAAGSSDGKPASAPAPAGEMSIAEKNAEFKKRRMEQAEKEKKAAEEARLAAEKAKNCERARDYQRVLDAGERVARIDKNGERAFLTDEQRAQESRDARRVLEGCK
ncbi:MAG TPA: DUF4124 domain-containing protein [Noviherbaspirillum sp.]|uniref:DUF4124 domain-containing protein n=1 Tax=Noviherbaspirillum sp. TaxID=1926288 RepID=UPI002D419D5D|nr:DUF4124 domain-containing protein [Noviherbaspirillum sp.]HYD95738.1 DUF4124 domain-containing protein [Noviherbaspirillum sp.]